MGKVGKLRKKRRLERELTKGGAEAEIDEEEEYLDEEDTKPPVGTTMTLHDIVSATRVITGPHCIVSFSLHRCSLGHVEGRISPCQTNIPHTCGIPIQ
eukprot:354523-Rhodomonas_salina.3